MAKKKNKLGYDKRGGVMAVSRGMRESMTYQKMPPAAKVLMDLLHMQWRPDKPVSYGVREAAKKIGCTTNTAGKSFKILIERGFIVCFEQSMFNSKTGSRTRDWRLTWMPFDGKNPTHDWEKWVS
jgi:DNA-binding transcriptional regulator YhcF (GntR family)